MTSETMLPDVPQLSQWDRIVGVFSARAMNDRVRHRWQAWMMDQQMSRYKAGERNRLNADWMADNRDIMTILRGKLKLMQARSRWLIRNNPYGSGAINNFLNYIVGTGLSLQMQARRYEFQMEDGKQVLVPVELESWNDWTEDRFASWAVNCDVSGTETMPVSFTDCQWLAFRKWFEDGEAFIHLVEDFSLPGVPLRLQFIEPESLDLTKMEHAGNPVIMGVEVHRKTSQPLGYWVWMDTGLNPYSPQPVSMRIDASRMVHLFTRLRPGQVRGVPWMAAVMERFFQLDEYADAELIGNKIAACFSVFITTPEGKEVPILAQEKGLFPKDAAGNAIANIAPGIIGTGLPAGSEIHTVSPQKPGATFGMFTRFNQIAMASGIEGGMSYHALTRDTAGTTFASGRLAQQQDYQGYRPIQGRFAARFCTPILNRWMDLAVMKKEVSAPGYYSEQPGKEFWQRHAWMPPGWTWGINPLQEVNAARESMRSGLTSYDDECALLGYEGKTQLRKISRMRRMAKRLGILLDSDPADDKGRTASAAAADPGMTDEEPADDPAKE